MKKLTQILISSFALFFITLLLVPLSFALELNPQTDLEKKSMELINNSVVGEQIKEFNVTIEIQKDGSIDITEYIRYYFDSERHGIYRNIPFTLYDNQTRYDMDFTFKPVTNEKNKKYNVDKSKNGERWTLKIGDPDKTITGEHTYIISYKVKGALRYFKDHDELFWNITGNEWEVPIKKATATINLPEKLSEADIKLECFTGPFASTKKNCTASTNGKSTYFATTLFLNTYEGLTIAKGFPKGIVAELRPEIYVPFFERWYGKLTLVGIIIAAILWYLVLPVYLIIKWFREGIDPDVGIPVTAAFEAPKIGKRSLTPAETGALLDEHVDKRDLFATIVDLARRGYLKIREPKDKEFHLDKTTPKTRKADPGLLPFELTLYNGIFATGDTVELKKVKFYTTASLVETQIYNLMVEHKYFAKNPRTTRNKYYALGTVALTTFNFVLAFIAFISGRHMPAKTLHGAQAATRAKGLKNFLTSQERQMNFQGDKQMLFEKLLPYASAFGVEKAWSKRFEKLDLKNPEWYEGASGRSFNSYVFASHLSNSYSSFASSSTPPSSSSSSGFSGSSSGGGGGGGGGGSW